MSPFYCFNRVSACRAICPPLWGGGTACGGRGVMTSSDLAIARPPSPEGKAFLPRSFRGAKRRGNPPSVIPSFRDQFANWSWESVILAAKGGAEQCSARNGLPRLASKPRNDAKILNFPLKNRPKAAFLLISIVFPKLRWRRESNAPG